jgi:hypothetical protein
MRLHGYCDDCHKVKMVRVNMSRWLGRGVPRGQCDDCAEKSLHPSRGGR